MERALKQAAWADAKLFATVSQMPPAALAATYASAEWPVGRLLHHIVTGLEWYRYVLTGVKWTDVEPATDGMAVAKLGEYASTLHDEIFEQVFLEDETISFQDEDGPSKVQRSTILAMVVHHSTEHRAQIGAALESHEIPGLNLDDLDLWAYEAANG